MTRFVKEFLFELALYVVGFITYRIIRELGRMTIKLGHAVFSR